MGFISNFISSFAGRVVAVLSAGSRSEPWTRAVGQQKTCAAIMDCTATHVAKGTVLHVVVDGKGRTKEIKRNSIYTKIFEKPNPIMSGYDFLYALSWQLDEKNTALAWIDWDVGAVPKAIWPIYYDQWQLMKIVGEPGYALQFTSGDGMLRTVRLEDIIVLRKHYTGFGFSGGSNQPVYDAITMAEASDKGLMDAIAGANRIHGTIQLKNALLSQKSVDKNGETLEKRIEAAASGKGILALDATEVFTPINVNPWAASSAQMKDVQNNLYDYFRTPREVVNNTASEQTMQNWYESKVEPRWLAMSKAFTEALFTRRERDVGNRIVVSGSAAVAASWATRMNILNFTKEAGDLTTNERRELMGYPPVEGGDERQVSLNYVKSTQQSEYQTGKKTEPKKGGEKQNAE